MPTTQTARDELRQRSLSFPPALFADFGLRCAELVRTAAYCAAWANMLTVAGGAKDYMGSHPTLGTASISSRCKL